LRLCTRPIREAKESRKSNYPALSRRRARFFLCSSPTARILRRSRAIRAIGIREVANIEAVDPSAANVPAGQYSLLVRVTFQSRETTLTEAQLSDFSTRIIAALEKTA